MQVPVSLSEINRTRWRNQFLDAQSALERKENGSIRIVWALLDGFLLYWDKVSKVMQPGYLLSNAVHHIGDCRFT
jgi:hypothetical protein